MTPPSLPLPPRAPIVRRLPSRVSLIALIAPIALASALAPASTASPAATPPQNPPASPPFSIDPSWPQKTPGIPWRQVPGVAVDAHDNVWIFTRAEIPIQLYSPSGQLIRSWGKDLVKNAHHLRLDPQGHVWITDTGLHTVRKFTPEGDLLLTLGTPHVPGQDQTHFNQPTDIAFTQNGDLLVADGYGNSRIVRYDSTGRFQATWGSLGSGPHQLSLPHAIATDRHDRVFVADRNNARIQVYSPNGELLDSWAQLLIPWGLWIDPSDHLWVCGSSLPKNSHLPSPPDRPLGLPPPDQIVLRLDPSGKPLQRWTFPLASTSNPKPGELNWVHGIALDSKGNLYLGDILGKRIQKFVPASPSTPTPSPP